MESDKITAIWKANAMRQIDNYSDAEVTAIVLRTVRRAINRSYPGILFWSALILFNLSCVWLMTNYFPPRLQTYGIVLTVVMMATLLAAVCISECGRRKTQRYSFDMPLKEWIESRIREFDKDITRLKKNWFLKYGFGVIALLIFCLIYVFTVGFSFKVLLIQLASGLTALVIVSVTATRVTLKRLIESRRQLHELLDLLKESEESEGTDE